MLTSLFINSVLLRVDLGANDELPLERSLSGACSCLC